MQDLNDLYYYVQVLDHGGFAPAGRALGIPKSKLSRRIAALETRLGVRLIQRSTRRFSVTEIGQTYYSHCKAMLVEAQAAQEAIDVIHTDPQGIVRITCPVALLHTNVEGMLVDFMVDNPRVTIHLEATNRRVDPVGEGIDIALRVRPPPIEDSDLVMRILANRSQRLVASPALITRLGLPKIPDDLADWPSLAHGDPQGNHTWDLIGPKSEQITLRHTPRMVTNDMAALHSAALGGLGAVQLPVMMIRATLAQGALVNLLPGWAPRTDIVHAVFPSRRGLLPSVRALVDYLAEGFDALDED
ncbi:LysR family transcriptional regulator [Alcaligenaceae bacterium CGII-47]|nr:LysR family transcriptional regulator [Alcaligenaceae bacterium CGII-47]